MKIVDIQTHDSKSIHQAANLLVEGFKLRSPNAWPYEESALIEIREYFTSDRISRIAIVDDGSVLGWIGGIRQHDRHAWELHPLIVTLDHQGQGIGHALVSDLESRVRERGGITIFLGTDDENSLTTLGGTDLYPNILEHIANIQNLRGHPYAYHQRLGYVSVGDNPDANGPGKPDILMAKCLRTDSKLKYSVSKPIDQCLNRGHDPITTKFVHKIAD